MMTKFKPGQRVIRKSLPEIPNACWEIGCAKKGFSPTETFIVVKSYAGCVILRGMGIWFARYFDLVKRVQIEDMYEEE